MSRLISFGHFEQEDHIPIYQQIIGFIKRGIVAGTITGGEEMPSRRTLSVPLGINPSTVQKSYAALEAEGLLRSRCGAKSCGVADEGTIRGHQQELLRDRLRAVAVDMKQMGMTREETLAALSRYWDAEPCNRK